MVACLAAGALGLHLELPPPGQEQAQEEPAPEWKALDREELLRRADAAMAAREFDLAERLLLASRDHLPRRDLTTRLALLQRAREEQRLATEGKLASHARKWDEAQRLAGRMPKDPLTADPHLRPAAPGVRLIINGQPMSLEDWLDAQPEFDPRLEADARQAQKWCQDRQAVEPTEPRSEEERQRRHRVAAIYLAEARSAEGVQQVEHLLTAHCHAVPGTTQARRINWLLWREQVLAAGQPQAASNEGALVTPAWCQERRESFPGWFPPSPTHQAETARAFLEAATHRLATDPPLAAACLRLVRCMTGKDAPLRQRAESLLEPLEP